MSYPLSYIYNLSITQGVFTASFKKGVVVLLFIMGNHSQCSYIYIYRSIALSLSISKIFEKCLKDRILNFLNKRDFFSKHQFGVLSGRSTNDTLFAVNTFLHDFNNKVLGIFLDIKKAFDSVNHIILIKKLFKAGLRSNIYNLIKSYLSNIIK